MAKSKIVEIKLSDIDPNPMRQLDVYPFSETKIDTLRRSIRSVGFWEGVIARPAGQRFQLAFGHHRIQAARLEQLTSVPIVVRDLDDRDMLRFMGRENLEDFRTNFLVLFEAYEGAHAFLTAELAAENPGSVTDPGNDPIAPMTIAELLGWTRIRQDNGSLQLSDAADACRAAHQLMRNGDLKREDLAELALDTVRAIVERVVAKQREIERDSAKSDKEKARDKRIAGKAGVQTAHEAREGEVAAKQVKNRVDYNSWVIRASRDRELPVFVDAGKNLARQISRMLEKDASKAKFDILAQLLEDVRKRRDKMLDEDVRALKRIGHECYHAADRFKSWGDLFSDPESDVARLRRTP